MKTKKQKKRRYTHQTHSDAYIQFYCNNMFLKENMFNSSKHAWTCWKLLCSLAYYQGLLLCNSSIWWYTHTHTKDKAQEQEIRKNHHKAKMNQHGN